MEAGKTNHCAVEDVQVTVITPTYNQGTFIGDTIRSVVSQTYKNIEYIIVDNESDDGTEQIVRRFIVQYDNIKYFREKDAGQADALNKGFDLAAGSIVCWLNSDDYYFDHSVIGRIVQLFQENEDVDVIYGDGFCSDKDGNILYSHRINQKHVSMKYFNILCPILQPSSFWRKNEIRLRNDYPHSFDWLFFREMYLKKKKFYYLNQSLSVYRMYDSNKTGTDSWIRRKELFDVVRNHIGPYHIIAAGFYLIYLSYRFSAITGLTGVANTVKKISKWVGEKV
ncbi:MAG TPA: glycosyltransferase family 2 protein [Smithellaceae bacterium]|nr:glycosyltransferase family 2 protein [Smithellaceae bacterium]